MASALAVSVVGLAFVTAVLAKVVVPAGSAAAQTIRKRKRIDATLRAEDHGADEADQTRRPRTKAAWPYLVLIALGLAVAALAAFPSRNSSRYAASLHSHTVCGALNYSELLPAPIAADKLVAFYGGDVGEAGWDLDPPRTASALARSAFYTGLVHLFGFNR